MSGIFSNGGITVMGILNVTPDSFSDGGSFFEPQTALGHARLMLEQGADIIDVGAQSTRPGASPLTPEEEIERLAPVLSLLCGEKGLVFSVDTFYPDVARFALENGASAINDVSGHVNPEIALAVREHNAGWIITHNNGGAGASPEYPEGVCRAVREFFENAVAAAEDLGVPRGSLCLDPGFGFGKSTQDNFALLRGLSRLVLPGIPLMAALSRKRFLGDASGETEPQSRLPETLAANALAIAGGATVLRVHDVLPSRRAADIALKYIENGKELRDG